MDSDPESSSDESVLEGGARRKKRVKRKRSKAAPHSKRRRLPAKKRPAGFPQFNPRNNDAAMAQMEMARNAQNQENIRRQDRDARTKMLQARWDKEHDFKWTKFLYDIKMKLAEQSKERNEDQNLGIAKGLTAMWAGLPFGARAGMAAAGFAGAVAGGVPAMAAQAVGAAIAAAGFLGAAYLTDPHVHRSVDQAIASFRNENPHATEDQMRAMLEKTFSEHVSGKAAPGTAAPAEPSATPQPPPKPVEEELLPSQRVAQGRIMLTKREYEPKFKALGYSDDLLQMLYENAGHTKYTYDGWVRFENELAEALKAAKDPRNRKLLGLDETGASALDAPDPRIKALEEQQAADAKRISDLQVEVQRATQAAVADVTTTFQQTLAVKEAEHQREISSLNATLMDRTAAHESDMRQLRNNTEHNRDLITQTWDLAHNARANQTNATEHLREEIERLKEGDSNEIAALKDQIAKMQEQMGTAQKTTDDDILALKQAKEKADASSAAVVKFMAGMPEMEQRMKDKIIAEAAARKAALDLQKDELKNELDSAKADLYTAIRNNDGMVADYARRVRVIEVALREMAGAMRDVDDHLSREIREAGMKLKENLKELAQIAETDITNTRRVEDEIIKIAERLEGIRLLTNAGGNAVEYLKRIDLTEALAIAEKRMPERMQVALADKSPAEQGAFGQIFGFVKSVVGMFPRLNAPVAQAADVKLTDAQQNDPMFNPDAPASDGKAPTPGQQPLQPPTPAQPAGSHAQVKDGEVPSGTTTAIPQGGAAINPPNATTIHSNVTGAETTPGGQTQLLMAGQIPQYGAAAPGADGQGGAPGGAAGPGGAPSLNETTGVVKPLTDPELIRKAQTDLETLVAQEPFKSGYQAFLNQKKDGGAAWGQWKRDNMQRLAALQTLIDKTGAQPLGMEQGQLGAVDASKMPGKWTPQSTVGFTLKPTATNAQSIVLHVFGGQFNAFKSRWDVNGKQYPNEFSAMVDQFVADPGKSYMSKISANHTNERALASALIPQQATPTKPGQVKWMGDMKFAGIPTAQLESAVDQYGTWEGSTFKPAPYGIDQQMRPFATQADANQQQSAAQWNGRPTDANTALPTTAAPMEGKGAAPMDVDLSGKGTELDENDIRQMMSAYDGKGFRGVVARDEIKNMQRHAKDGDVLSFVMNTDKRAQGGRHWVAVDWRGSNLHYYDPFGHPPPREVTKSLSRLVASDGKKGTVKLKVNRVPNQRADTVTCGAHAMRFLQDMAAGHSFARATDYDTREGEALARGLIKRKYSGMPKFKYI